MRVLSRTKVANRLRRKRRLALPCIACGVTGTPKRDGTAIGIPERDEAGRYRARLLCIRCYWNRHRWACRIERLPGGSKIAAVVPTRKISRFEDLPTGLGVPISKEGA